MKIGLTSICLLFCMVSIQAQNREQAKWTSLFNGKDLKGWKQLNGKAKFEAVNGEIAGTTVLNEPNSFLATEATYGDFILELEFKVDNMNSGIQFRSESKPDYQEGRVHGYQFEIDPSPRAWTGGIYDEGRRDWLYPLEYNPSAKTAYKAGAWNKVRIECIGNDMRTFVNDLPTAHLVDDMTPRGFIALQVHAINKPEEVGKQIHFKNIRIQTGNLKASVNDDLFIANLIPNNLAEQERLKGVTLLWDGKTTKGWKGAYKDKFPEQGWEIKDGTLNVLNAAGAESRNGGDIVTEQEYSAFDLQFEFKLSEGANSGVKYFVTETEGNPGSAIGLEYQVLDDERHPDAKEGVVGNRTQASLYDLIPSVKVKRGMHKIGEWNYGRIVVYPDNRVEHWLNGYKVVEYQRGNLIYQALVARSKYAGWKNFGMADKGRILLQDHGSAVAFRSIKIKEFK
ncbi:MAG TPA: DUF1080 domain-containing protein [Cyclobacteriaceae bacterium]|nr:DUF1080 domain-containing protein [Cyclobacteriaceae bacterium]